MGQGSSLNRSSPHPVPSREAGCALQAGSAACAGTLTCPGISLCPHLCRLSPSLPIPPGPALPSQIGGHLHSTHDGCHCSASTNAPLPGAVVGQAPAPSLCLGTRGWLGPANAHLHLYRDPTRGWAWGQAWVCTGPRHARSSPLQCKGRLLGHRPCLPQLWHWGEVTV